VKAKIKLGRYIKKKFRPKPVKKRKSFSDKVKNGVKKIQGYRCAHCRRRRSSWNMKWDHIRDRDDHSAQNCQWLCDTCHNRKTHYDAYKKKLDAKLEKEKT